MYYLLLFILYPLSLLPMRVLYIISDGVFLFLYYIAGYRKQLVRENITNAFPEKSVDELRQIERQFYRNFCDQWIETMKLLSISEQELNKRISGNWEVFDQLHKEGKNTYALLGHTFNWEWANVVCQYNSKQQFAGVYQPVSNQAFDQLMQRIRTRSGAWLISMKAKRGFQKLDGTQYIVGLIADQNPPVVKAAIWYDFMHRPAPFFRGPELLAQRANTAVVFAGIKKVKRGYYQITLRRYADNAAELPAGKMMQDYVLFMEQQLKEQAANWMWTHNRWKYQR